MKHAKAHREDFTWTWVGLAVLSMAWSMAAHHGPADRALLQWLNGGAEHWRWWIELLGQLGLGATQWLLLSALLLRVPQPWAVLSLSLVVCAVSVQLLKYLLDLPRPLAVLPQDSVQVLGDALRRRAMPSGHTASAFALLGAMLGLRWRPWALATAALMALAVAWSRVAAGAHWPSDVLAGAALGLACGLVC
ncbi:MAG: phosphatase PAP2 family protein, partial [Burkholderiales bacterium]|nr:phosphatase PAP2 family protein [Burkholderiales bacterium]